MKTPFPLLGYVRNVFVAFCRKSAAAWLVLGVMVAGGVWFVATFGLTMPYGDEWAWLPVAAGEEPISLAWLWSTHFEHRMFLPRLLYVSLGAISDFNFRAGAFYNIFILSGLSAAMMLTARRLRGHSSACDAFFPLVFLHWAQAENMIWGFQLNFVTSVALASAVLSIISCCGRQVTVWSALPAAVCLVGLGLCGLYGLAYLPALACWLLFAGLCRWREDTSRGRYGLLVMLLAVAPLALVAGYFADFPHRVCHSPGLFASLTTSLQFLCGGLGPGAKEIWPFSGGLVLVAVGYSLWQLYGVWHHQPAERVRAAGLLCFLGGIGCLALAIGLGRASLGPRAGFQTRYMTLGAPLLCLLYLQFTLYGSPAKRVHLQRVLALLMCGLLVINTQKGICYAVNSRRSMSRLEEDIRSGLPTAVVALRHGEDMRCGATDVAAERLEMLRRARLGPYRGVEGNAAETLCAGRPSEPSLSTAAARPLDLTQRPTSTQ